MKHYCYVMVSSDGDSHWTRVIARSTEEIEKPNWDDANLTRLLQSGWRPLRETPMGGDPGYAFCLLLLERDG